MNPETLEDWGERVKKRRTGMRLTQRRLGQLCNADQSTISRLERGRLEGVSDELKWKIAGALGTTVDRLFPYPNVRPPFPEALAGTAS